jgi:DNA-directed RNA polymerase subunit M/transcription elongation factor TFIIS
MAKLKSDEGTLNTEHMAALMADPTTGEMDPLRELLLMELQEKRAAREKERSELKRLQLQNVKNTQAAQEQTRHNQLMCNHLKMNGQTRLRGAILSNGTKFLLCQNCHKEWRNGFDNDGNQLQPHLWIDEDWMSNAS